jgi:hypothetical protein
MELFISCPHGFSDTDASRCWTTQRLRYNLKLFIAAANLSFRDLGVHNMVVMVCLKIIRQPLRFSKINLSFFFIGELVKFRNGVC